MNYYLRPNLSLKNFSPMFPTHYYIIKLLWRLKPEKNKPLCCAFEPIDTKNVKLLSARNRTAMSGEKKLAIFLFLIK